MCNYHFLNPIAALKRIDIAYNNFMVRKYPFSPDDPEIAPQTKPYLIEIF